MDLLDPFDLRDPTKKGGLFVWQMKHLPGKFPFLHGLWQNTSKKTGVLTRALKRFGDGKIHRRMVSRFSVAIRWMELLVIEIG